MGSVEPLFQPGALVEQLNMAAAWVREQPLGDARKRGGTTCERSQTQSRGYDLDCGHGPSC